MHPRRLLRIVQSYVELIQDLNVAANDGVLRLYRYKTASGESLGVPLTDLKELLQERYSRRYDREMIAFADGCVQFNISVYIDLMSTLIRDKIAYVKEKGVDSDISPIYHLSCSTADEIREYVLGENHTSYTRNNDSMSSIAQMCAIDAMLLYNQDRTTFVEVDDFLDKLMYEFDSGRTFSSYTEFHLPAIKAVFFIMCMYFGMKPNDIEKCRTLSTPVIGNYMVSDTTLAAMPFPTHELIEACQDASMGYISQIGTDYLDALSAFSIPKSRKERVHV